MKRLTVTRDTCANLKHLKRLEQEGFVKVFNVMLENARGSGGRKILPTTILDHSRLDECVLAGKDSVYEDIVEIIGRNNIKDAMFLEAHIRNGHDYFVTEDKDDILNRRAELKNKFGVKIVTSKELEDICHELYGL